MIRPAAFCDNPQTRLSNAFQSGISDAKIGVTARVCAEFDSLVDVLRSNGVVTYVFEGRAQRDAPDEVFPNNWVSTHADGTVVLYPMMAGNRRHERRPELFQTIDSDSDYHTTRMIDLTAHEKRHRYLEGTGSLVLDRINRIAYANLSPRTHLDVLEDFSKQLGYESVSFEATDNQKRPIYHTNVLMSVGTGFAVICSKTIKARTKLAVVLESLRSSGREVIEVHRQQLPDFPANLMALRSCSPHTLGGRWIRRSEVRWHVTEKSSQRQSPLSNEWEGAAYAACSRKFTCRTESAERDRMF